jgi:hypothetical protein
MDNGLWTMDYNNKMFTSVDNDYKIAPAYA